jgi:hypothetical protein
MNRYKLAKSHEYNGGENDRQKLTRLRNPPPKMMNPIVIAAWSAMALTGVRVLAFIRPNISGKKFS